MLMEVYVYMIWFVICIWSCKKCTYKCVLICYIWIWEVNLLEDEFPLKMADFQGPTPNLPEAMISQLRFLPTDCASGSAKTARGPATPPPTFWGFFQVISFGDFSPSWSQKTPEKPSHGMNHGMKNWDFPWDLMEFNGIYPPVNQHSYGKSPFLIDNHL